MDTHIKDQNKMEKEKLKTPSEDDVLNKIKKWSSVNFSSEVCGLIGQENENYVVVLCANKSKNPSSSFVIDPLEYLLFLEKYNVIGLFHSHITGDETESEKDIMMSENSCLPFFIYSLNTENFNIYVPKKSKVNVETLDSFINLA